MTATAAGSPTDLCVDTQGRQKKKQGRRTKWTKQNSWAVQCGQKAEREMLRGYSMLARWTVGWRGLNVCLILRFGAPETMNTHMKKIHSSVACLLRWQPLPALPTPQHTGNSRTQALQPPLLFASSCFFFGLSFTIRLLRKAYFPPFMCLDIYLHLSFVSAANLSADRCGLIGGQF